MNLMLAAVVLGLIQGLGEFLPISSSGHLILTQAAFGLMEPEVAFDIVLHLGTLAAVFFFYRDSFISLLKELRFLPGALISPKKMAELYFQRPDFRFGILIIVGSIPTGIMGLLLKNILTDYFTSVLSVGIALLCTGTLLRFAGHEKKMPRATEEMSLRDALIIGLVQGLAITPGLSRSGFTICAGLMLGLKRDAAARYSFILSVPAIIGASILEMRHGLTGSFNGTEFAVGFLVAAAVGYVSLRFLSIILKKDNFSVFSWWCWAMGLAAVGWSVFTA